MRRLHLFELEDQPWCPRFLRAGVTNTLQGMHRVVNTPRLWGPKLAVVMQHVGTNRIVDMCSGGGGPTPELVHELRTRHGIEARAVMTDLYPNPEVAAFINAQDDPNVEYRLEPLNAADVPPDLDGVRTIVCGFHHMPPEIAKSILRDAYDKRRAICIFEVTENSPLGYLNGILCLVTTQFLSFFYKPKTMTHFIFTWLVPIIPLTVTWDGIVSHLRTYSRRECEDLVSDLRDGYVWDIGKLRSPLMINAMPYMIGYPA